jgi:hypothetical protein
MTTISRYQFAFTLIWAFVFFVVIYPFVSSFWGMVIVCFGATFGLAGVRRWERARVSAKGG